MPVLRRLFSGLIPRNPYPHGLRDIAKAFFSNTEHDQILSQCLKVTGRNSGFFTKSGRHGLYLIFANLLQEGDEIILSAFSCNALVGPIIKSGIKPVFADVSLETLNSGVEHIAPLVTAKTKAVLMTHQLGYPADAEEIAEFCRAKGLLLIEDAAPAFGGELNRKKIGSFGNVAVFSFEKSKVISSIEGGLVVGEDAYIAKILSSLNKDKKSSSLYFAAKALIQCVALSRHVYPITLLLWRTFKGSDSSAHIWIPDTHQYSMGYDGLSDFQVGLLATGLDRLADILRNRRDSAVRITEVIGASGSGWTVPQQPVCGVKCSTYSRFPVLVAQGNPDKYEIQKNFQAYGIDLGFTFSYSMYPFFKDAGKGDLANTEWVAAHILNVPIHPDPTVNNEIAELLSKAITQHKLKQPR